MAQGASLKWILELVAVALRPLMKVVTAKIRDELIAFLKQWYVKAQATPNIFDDILVESIAKMFDVNLD